VVIHLPRNHETQISKSSTIREKQSKKQRDRQRKTKRDIDIDKDIGREKK
jgi:hypothetical protein